jgi:hypothetical protein
MSDTAQRLEASQKETLFRGNNFREFCWADQDNAVNNWNKYFEKTRRQSNLTN